MCFSRSLISATRVSFVAFLCLFMNPTNATAKSISVIVGVLFSAILHLSPFKYSKKIVDTRGRPGLMKTQHVGLHVGLHACDTRGRMAQCQTHAEDRARCCEGGLRAVHRVG